MQHEQASLRAFVTQLRNAVSLLNCQQQQPKVLHDVSASLVVAKTLQAPASQSSVAAAAKATAEAAAAPQVCCAPLASTHRASSPLRELAYCFPRAALLHSSRSQLQHSS